MKEKTGSIYRIYNRMNGKAYIGKTIHPNSRIWKHFSCRYSTSPALWNAVKKYGKEAFVVEILESDVPESHLSKLEILYIRFFNSKAPNGYNLTDGGEGVSGIKPSKETLHKRSKALKGKRRTPETRRRMSEAAKRRGISPQTLRKAHEANKGRTPWNKGKTDVISDETRLKMSNAKQGKPPWNKGKPQSPEQRRINSDSHKGQTPWNKDKKLSPEHRDAIPHKFDKGHIPWNKGKKGSQVAWNKGKKGIYSEEQLTKIRRPEYDEANEYYCSLSVDMPIKEKNKRVRKAFSNVPYSTIHKWLRRWEAEQTKEQTKSA